MKPAQDSTDLLREPSGLQEVLEERETMLVSAQQPLPCLMLSVPELCPPVGLLAREIRTVLTTASAV